MASRWSGMPDDTQPYETFDAADPAAIDNASRDAARITREDADVLRRIMHDKKGRAWLVRQLDACGINSARKFAPGAADQTAFNLGRESYGSELLISVMAASTDLYMTAIKEQQAEEVRLNDVRRQERVNREAVERPPRAADMLNDLPPPGSSAPVAGKRKR